MCNSESIVNSLASPSSPIGGFHIDDLEAPFAPLEGMSPLESITQTHVNQQHNEALPHLSLGPHEQFLGMHPISLPFTIPSNAPPHQQVQQLDPTIPSLTPHNTPIQQANEFTPHIFPGQDCGWNVDALGDTTTHFPGWHPGHDLLLMDLDLLNVHLEEMYPST